MPAQREILRRGRARPQQLSLGLEAEFGEAAAFRMESDIGQVLGQPLADWLDGPFVKWHTSLSCDVTYTKPNGQLEFTLIYFDSDYVLQEEARQEP